MRASVRPGDEFTVAPPQVLFESADRYPPSNATFFGRNWDLHPDGQRFVMIANPNVDGSGSGGLSVRLVTNWFEELRQRMGN